MTLVFDTDVLIELELGNTDLINKLREMKAIHPENPSITFANFSEIYYGFLSKKQEQKNKILNFLNNFTFLNTTYRSSKTFSELKYSLDRKGIILPLFDILIASIVINSGMTLLTYDKHFEKIEELNSIVLPK